MLSYADYIQVQSFFCCFTSFFESIYCGCFCLVLTFFSHRLSFIYVFCLLLVSV
jgi:hypothetical protein